MALLAAAGCGGVDGPGNRVEVQDNVFVPSTLAVPVGTTVEWDWVGRAPHDVVFSTSAGGPHSTQRTWGQWVRTFAATGTYDYVCTLHAGMTGSIIVR